MEKKLPSFSPILLGGFGLIEIVIASALTSLLIIGFGQAIEVSLRLLQEERARFEATLLGEEAIEAIRTLRDAGWSNNIRSLSTGSAYYLTATSTWGIWTDPQPYIDGKYWRTVRLDSVNREAGSDRIATSGGYTDAGTRKVTATVSWRSRGATTSVESVTYITDFLQN